MILLGARNRPSSRRTSTLKGQKAAGQPRNDPDQFGQRFHRFSVSPPSTAVMSTTDRCDRTQQNLLSPTIMLTIRHIRQIILAFQDRLVGHLAVSGAASTVASMVISGRRRHGPRLVTAVTPATAVIRLQPPMAMRSHARPNMAPWNSSTGRHAVSLVAFSTLWTPLHPHQETAH
jgi:hypothetical protein